MCLLKRTHMRNTEFCPSLVIEFYYSRDTKLMRVIKAARQIFENSIAKDCWTCVIVEPPQQLILGRKLNGRLDLLPCLQSNIPSSLSVTAQNVKYNIMKLHRIYYYITYYSKCLNMCVRFPLCQKLNPSQDSKIKTYWKLKRHALAHPKKSQILCKS